MNVSKKATVDLFSINPKCISLGELYGEIDANTMEWSDGLLAAAVRLFSKQANVVENEMATASASPDATSRSSSRMSKTSTDHDLESIGWFDGFWRLSAGFHVIVNMFPYFISFHFIFLYLTTVAPSICLDCFAGGRAKKLHNQKYKTYFTIILTDITEITDLYWYLSQRLSGLNLFRILYAITERSNRIRFSTLSQLEDHSSFMRAFSIIT